MATVGVKGLMDITGITFITDFIWKLHFILLYMQSMIPTNLPGYLVTHTKKQNLVTICYSKLQAM